MKTAVLRKSGGSVILSIPRPMIESMGVDVDSPVVLSVHGRTLSVAPAYSIDQLLAGVTAENTHGLLMSGDVGLEQID